MGIDIANNIKAVELLKVETLQKLTDLFGDIAAEANGETTDRIAEDGAALICSVYLLCHRLGVDFTEMDTKMKAMLRTGMQEKHLLERRFGDLQTLLDCLEERKDEQ